MPIGIWRLEKIRNACGKQETYPRSPTPHLLLSNRGIGFYLYTRRNTVALIGIISETGTVGDSTFDFLGATGK
jgi:hypothetical protein